MNRLCREVANEKAIRVHQRLQNALLQEGDRAAASGNRAAVSALQKQLQNTHATIAALRQERNGLLAQREKNKSFEFQHAKNVTNLANLKAQKNALVQQLGNNMAAQTSKAQDIADLQLKLEIVQGKLDDALKTVNTCTVNSVSKQAVIIELQSKLEDNETLKRKLERAVANIANRNGDRDRLTKAYSNTTQEKQELEKRLVATQTEIETLQQAVARLTLSHESDQIIITRLTQNVRNRNKRLEDEEKQVKNHTNAAARLKSLHSVLEEKVKSLSEEVSELSQQKRMVDNKLSAYENSNQKQKSNIVRIQAELQSTRELKSVLEQTIVDLQQQILTLCNDVQSSKTRGNKQQENLSQLGAQYQQVKAARDSLIAELQEIKNAKTTFEAEASAREQTLQAAKQDLEDRLQSVSANFTNTRALLQQSINQAQRNKTASDARLTNLQRRHDVLNAGRLEAETALASLREELRALREAQVFAEQQYKVDETKLRDEIVGLNEVVTRLKTSEQVKDSTIAELQKKRDELQTKLQQEVNSMAGLQQASDSTTRALQEQVEMLQAQLLILQQSKEGNEIELQAQIQALRRELDQSARQLQNCRDQNEQLSQVLLKEAQQEIQKVTENRNRMAQNLNRLQNQRKTVQQSTAARNRQIEEYQMRIKAHNVANRGKEDQLQRLQRQIKECGARAETGAKQIDSLQKQLQKFKGGKAKTDLNVVHDPDITLEERRPDFVRAHPDRRAVKSGYSTRMKDISANRVHNLIPAFRGQQDRDVLV
jgi:chromosome segregation ATPase